MYIITKGLCVVKLKNIMRSDIDKIQILNSATRSLNTKQPSCRLNIMAKFIARYTFDTRLKTATRNVRHGDCRRIFSLVSCNANIITIRFRSGYLAMILLLNISSRAILHWLYLKCEKILDRTKQQYGVYSGHPWEDKILRHLPLLEKIK